MKISSLMTIPTTRLSKNNIMLCYIAFEICIHFNTYAKNVTCFWILCKCKAIMDYM